MKENTTLAAAGITTFDMRWRHQKDGLRTLRNFNRATHFGELDPGTFVQHVTADRLYSAANAMLEAGLSTATTNRLLASVTSALGICADLGLILQVPRYRRHKENKGRSYVMPSATFHSLCQAATHKHQAIFTFLMHTGCRVGELYALKHADVRWAERQKGAYKTATEVTFRDTKTGQDRTVPLSPTAGAALGRLYAPVAGTVYRALESHLPSRSALNREWARCRKEIGQENNPEFVMHCLRHTYASELSAKDVPIQHIQALLGHSDIATTMRYTHTNLETLRGIVGGTA